MKNFFPVFLLTFPAICIGGNLTYVKTQARLPTPRFQSAGIFDGDDTIFIFGGRKYHPVTFEDEILKYTISTESVEIVGKLSTPARFSKGNVITINSAGIINAFPTYPSQSVTEFNPVTNQTRLVGDLSELGIRDGMPFAQITKTKVALMGGASSAFYKDIVLVDLETLELSPYKVDVYPGSMSLSAATYDASSETLYTTGRNITSGDCSIMRYHFGEEEFEHVLDIPEFGASAGAIWADGKMYVVDFTAKLGGEDEGIAVFDPIHLTYEHLPVHGLNKTLENLQGMAVVYVEKLQRIYLFGGFEPGKGEKDGIWYIDLGIPISPTDAPTTSTPAPPLFSCSTKPDGFYPHPQDCKRFLGCLDEELSEYECPDALLFDPTDLTCKHANNVLCELSCVGRPDGVYPHPEDCTLFLTCHADLGEVNKCPEPLLFDPTRFMCNFPHLVDCGNATTASFW